MWAETSRGRWCAAACLLPFFVPRCTLPPLCPQADAQPEDDSVINILVASDLHLGYLEKDPIRGEDSFATFNEVFQIANERKVWHGFLHRNTLPLPSADYHSTRK